MVLGRLGRRQSFLRIYSRRRLLANAVMADSRPLPSFVVVAGVWASRRAPKSLMMGFARSLHSLRHHVAVEIGDDPDGARNNEKDDQHAEGESQNIVRAIGPAAQMQEEHEVDADLREGEYDQSDGYARGPEQIGLRHDERGDRRQDRKHQTYRVRQVAGRGLMLLDTRRPVLEQTIAH